MRVENRVVETPASFVRAGDLVTLDGRPVAASATGSTCQPGTPSEGKSQMAAMKPRTGDGPMEVTKEGRSLIMRVPIDGGGRLVLEINADEARELKECLEGVIQG